MIELSHTCHSLAASKFSSRGGEVRSKNSFVLDWGFCRFGWNLSNELDRIRYFSFRGLSIVI